MKWFSKVKKYGVCIATMVFCCCIALLFAVNVNYTAMADDAGDEVTEETIVMPEDNHSCLYFTGEGDYAVSLGPVNNQVWAGLMEELSTVSDNDFATGLFCGYMYLTEDVTWEESAYIPKNVHIAICLNGY